LKEAGIQMPPDAMKANWRGTSPLTSRPKQVASERVILIGDAGGYVEPFTGEGMATALESAVAVVPLAIEARKSWSPSLATSWESLHRQMVRSRQRTCQQLAWILRRPWAAIATLSACRIAPGIAGQLIAKTSAPTSFRPATEMSTT
jgi:flavin-dependent dehydrogenase